MSALHLLALAGLVAGAGAPLTLNIDASEIQEGAAIVVQLFDGEQGFPKAPTATTLQRTTVVKSGFAQVVFEDVKPGVYAGVVFADLDSDGLMGRNWFGFPTEPVGLTLQPGTTLRGPPNFKVASFEVAAEPLRFQVSMWTP